MLRLIYLFVVLVAGTFATFVGRYTIHQLGHRHSVSGLTIHSSRSRFAARLNSGVRRHNSKASAVSRKRGSYCFLRTLLFCCRVVALFFGYHAGRAAGFMLGVCGFGGEWACRERAGRALLRIVHCGKCPGCAHIHSDFGAVVLRYWHPSRIGGIVPPNNSFKPNPLRYLRDLKFCGDAARLNSGVRRHNSKAYAVSGKRVVCCFRRTLPCCW